MDTTVFDPLMLIETVLLRGDDSAWTTLLNSALQWRTVPRFGYFLGRLGILALRYRAECLPELAHALETDVAQLMTYIADARRYELQMDVEFKALIPPLLAEQRRTLEESLLLEGWRENEKIITWRGVIVDGHTRYEICRLHHLHFETLEREFSDREAVMVWMIHNQLGRRNLSDYLYGKLALRMKEIISVRAKRQQGKPLEFQPACNTRAELADIAHISHWSMGKVIYIDAHAPALIQQAAEAEQISVDRAYQLTKALETLRVQNPRYHSEIVQRGRVMNLDGEDIPLLDADPTLLRVTGVQNEYETALRHEGYLADYKGRQKDRKSKVGDWLLTFKIDGSEMKVDLAPDIAAVLGGTGTHPYRVVIYRVDEDVEEISQVKGQ